MSPVSSVSPESPVSSGSWRPIGAPRIPRLAFTVLLSIPLALLALAPLSGRAAAHPAAPHTNAAGQIGQVGKSSGPAMNITLHFHSFIQAPFSQPFRMGSDSQGNLYISDLASDKVSMFNASDVFVRYFGTGTIGTGGGNFDGPEGVAVSGNTVFVADFYNHQIQTFNKTTGVHGTDFGASHLASPYGVTLGSNGQLYVADGYGGDRVVRFDILGNYLGSFGSAGSGNGLFNGAVGISGSPLGFIYVTDVSNKRVQQFSLTGTYLNQWGHFGFNNPSGIAVDRSGMVYVVDRGVQIIYKFDSGGSFVGSYAAPATSPVIAGTFTQPTDVVVRSLPNTPIAVFISDLTTGLVQRFDQVINPQYHTYQAQWGSMGNVTGQFNDPRGVVVDNAGNVYVSDENNDRIEKFDQFGNFQIAFGSSGSGNGQLSSPSGMALSPDGHTLYVADFANNRIEEFNAAGSYVGQFGGAGSGNGQFTTPDAIATDGTFLYVADTGNNRIQVFTTGGTYAWQFGSSGTGNGQFNLPFGIAVDINRQELFVDDFYNNRIQVFSTDGTFLTAITTVGSGSFSHPVGVQTDQRGDVYVADENNGRIYEMDVNTTRWTTFGSAGSGNGQFNNPRDVAVSPTNGQLYVVDSGNNRVQRFGSPWAKYDTIGIYRPSTKTFYLRNSNSTGPADITVPMSYALAGDLPIVGDWNGDGVDTVGLYRTSTGTFLLQDANVPESAPDYTFTLGISGDTPISGDWSGSGHDGAGVFRPSSGILYLKNALTTGYADYSMVLGIPGDKGIAADANGDGQDSPGVYRPSNQTFYLSDKVTNGAVFADHVATLGISGDAPFTGDWTASGSSGIGVFRPSSGITYEKNVPTTGFADNNFIYGSAGDIPVAGEWIALQIPFSVPPHQLLGTSNAHPVPTTTGKPGPAGLGGAPIGVHPAIVPRQPATH